MAMNFNSKDIRKNLRLWFSHSIIFLILLFLLTDLKNIFWFPYLILIATIILSKKKELLLILLTFLFSFALEFIGVNSYNWFNIGWAYSPTLGNLPVPISILMGWVVFVWSAHVLSENYGKFYKSHRHSFLTLIFLVFIISITIYHPSLDPVKTLIPFLIVGFVYLKRFFNYNLEFAGFIGIIYSVLMEHIALRLGLWSYSVEFIIPDTAWRYFLFIPIVITVTNIMQKSVVN